MFLAVVEDLFFFSKIQHTAKQAGVPVEAVAPEALQQRLMDSGVAAVFIDLNHRSGKAVESAAGAKQNPATRSVPLIAFLSHIQGDLAKAAKEAGCDLVIARSAFSKDLPKLIARFASSERSEESPNL